MFSGLLWFDNDPQRGLSAKVQDAALRYQEKFGVAPDTCYVNRAAVGDAEMVVPVRGLNLRVIPSGRILAHHFWVGVDN